MKTVIYSPTKYIQGPDELTKLHDYIQPLAKTGAYAIVDPFILDTYEAAITGSFAGKMPIHTRRFAGECSKVEINRIVEALCEAKCDVVVGVGGGKTLDTAKAVSYYAGLPVVIVPTAASTDAPCSALSVLYTEEGQFDEYLMLPSNPNIVLVDTTVIANAPVRLLVAGMGDALATFYEARACSRSRAGTMAGGVGSLAAMAIARACRDTLFSDGYRARLAVETKTVSSALENVVEANTYMSGIGFESGGLAAAHAIHNGMTTLEATHGMLHGEKVAFGTLVQLVLENAPDDEIGMVLAFCRVVGLPTTLAMLGAPNATPKEIMAVAEASCAEGETIHNMPFPVTPADVYSAILVADKMGAQNS